MWGLLMADFNGAPNEILHSRVRATPTFSLSFTRSRANQTASLGQSEAVLCQINRPRRGARRGAPGQCSGQEYAGPGGAAYSYCEAAGDGPAAWGTLAPTWGSCSGGSGPQSPIDVRLERPCANPFTAGAVGDMLRDILVLTHTCRYQPRLHTLLEQSTL